MGVVSMVKRYKIGRWWGTCNYRNLKVIQEAPEKVKVCVGCGCRLTDLNRSFDSCLCKNCWMVNLAEIEAEDRREDSLTDDERLARFLG